MIKIKNNNKKTSIIEKRHGKEDVEVATIGQAGENLVRYASVISSRSNHAMRLGVGAVMGSKNVKAIVLKGGKLPTVYDKEKLEQISLDFAERMKTNELSMWQKERRVGKE